MGKNIGLKNLVLHIMWLAYVILGWKFGVVRIVSLNPFEFYCRFYTVIVLTESVIDATMKIENRWQAIAVAGVLAVWQTIKNFFPEIWKYEAGLQGVLVWLEGALAIVACTLFSLLGKKTE